MPLSRRRITAVPATACYRFRLAESANPDDGRAVVPDYAQLAAPRPTQTPRRGSAHLSGPIRPEPTGIPRVTRRGIVAGSTVAASLGFVACTHSFAREGEVRFVERCAGCHTPAGTDRAAGPSLLGQLSPRAVVAALEDGIMRGEGSGMTAEQRIQVAEHLTGRRHLAEAIPEAALCADPPWNGIDQTAVSWMGIAGNLAGTGYQPPERAGLAASEVPDLELRWSFAFPGGTSMRTSPTVAGDVALVAGPLGEIVALDLATGCARWSFAADAAVRGAVVVGDGPGGRSSAWFVDARTSAYAVDLGGGSLL